MPAGTTKLDNSSQIAICLTTEQSMNAPAGSCKFLGVAASKPSRKLSLRNLQSNDTTLYALTKIVVSLLQYPQYLSDPGALYTQLTNNLQAAVASGNFTKTLQTTSASLNATTTQNTKCDSTESSKYSVQYPPSAPPTARPTSTIPTIVPSASPAPPTYQPTSQDNVNGVAVQPVTKLSPGIISAIVVSAFVLVISIYLIGHYFINHVANKKKTLFITEDSPINLDIREKKEETISLDDIETGPLELQIQRMSSVQDVSDIYNNNNESKHQEVSERVNYMHILKKKSKNDVLLEDSPTTTTNALGFRRTKSKLDLETNEIDKFAPIVPSSQSPFVNYNRPPKSKTRKVDEGTIIIMDDRIVKSNDSLALKAADSPVDETFLSYNDGMSTNGSDDEEPIVFINYSRPSSRNSSIGGKLHSRMNSFQLNNLDIILDEDLNNTDLEKEIARGGFKSPKRRSPTGDNNNNSPLFPLRRSASNDNITASAIASMPKSPSHDQVQRVLWKSSDLKDNENNVNKSDQNNVQQQKLVKETNEEKI